MKKRKAIGFDFDGVLVDSPMKKKRIFEDLMEKEFGIPKAKSRQAFLRGDGLSRKKRFEICLGHALSEKDAEKLSLKYQNMIRKEKFNLIPGTEAALKKAKKDFIIFSASGVPTKYLREALRKAGVFSYFDSCLGGEKKEIIKREIKRFKLEASDVFIVGDAINDMKVARSLKAHAIGVYRNINHRRKLIEAGAEKTIPNLKNLLKAINRISIKRQ